MKKYRPYLALAFLIVLLIVIIDILDYTDFSIKRAEELSPAVVAFLENTTAINISGNPSAQISDEQLEKLRALGYLK